MESLEWTKIEETRQSFIGSWRSMNNDNSAEAGGCIGNTFYWPNINGGCRKILQSQIWQNFL